MFWLFFVAIAGWMFYKFCAAIAGGDAARQNPRPRPPGPGSNPGSSRWFPGDHRDDNNSFGAPPPYSKTTAPDSYAVGSTWRPGFWTGAALGGAGATLLNRNNNQRQQQERQSYDWERERSSSYRRPSEDRGEGPSNLGSMRRSTGLGGSNVR